MQVEFQPLVRQATFIYCDQNHPLRQSKQVDIAELVACRWISPGYEDDVGPGSLGRLSRDFAARVDTMMNALLLLRHSPFLMSASSGFQSLLRSFGIEALAIEDPGQADDSGVIYPARSLDRPAVRDFLQLAQQTVSKLRLPTIE